MKKLSPIYFILLIIFSFSCSLEEDPYGFLSSDNFYKTEEDALSALAHMYDIMGDVEYYSRYLYYITEASTEACYFKDDVSVDQKDIDGLKTNSTNTILTWFFKAAYIGINRCNVVLENVANIEMEESSKNQILGEAYFLRALHNFNLVRTFGAIPLRKESIDAEEEVNIPLSSIQVIYGEIEDDLLMADSLMNDEVIYPRANKAATHALLARVYLTLASSANTGVPGYDFVSDPNSYYSLSAQYAEKVFDQNEFEFWEDELIDLWDIDNEIGNEFIFSIAFASDGEIEGDYSKLSMLVVPYINGTIIWLPPDFTTLIPDGWGHLKTGFPFYYSFSPSDKRRTDLFVSEIKDLMGNTRTIINGSLPYPFSRKHIDKYQNSQATGKDIPVIRYSDVMLAYAEAVGPTTEGYNMVNRIRNRAGLTDLTTGLSIEAFRDSVYQERTFELAFEGHHLFELRRLNKMEEVLEGQYGMTITEDPYFYAIPQSEVDNNTAIN